MGDANDLTRTRIVKRLAPDQPGTKKLAQRYGDALVCVRYRQDPQRGRRYTTVELVVDEGPISVRPPAPHAATVLVRIHLSETPLRMAACAMGAQWDPDTGAWLMSKRAASRLQLLDRVLLISPPMDSTNGKS
ncbi:MAG: hypothetical protein Q7U26_07350 [Aquabacterium sp.]|nr:hypothetical protein [Aquabacterium sp.]